jgi:protein-arginine kinase activator protein McsA
MEAWAAARVENQVFPRSHALHRDLFGVINLILPFLRTLASNGSTASVLACCPSCSVTLSSVWRFGLLH